MPTSKMKYNDEEAVVSQADGEIAQALTWSQSEVFNQIAHGIDCYNGKRPYATSEGFSSYVSRDVLDAVESMQTPLMEVFTANKQAVEFTSNVIDTPLLKLASKKINNVLVNNDGYRVLHSWIKDGLLSKNGIVKAYWEEKYAVEKHEFTNLTDEELELLLREPDVDEESMDVVRVELAEHNTLGARGLARSSGSLNRVKDASCIRIENVPPEEFIVSEMTRDIKNPQFVAHRQQFTIAEMRGMFPDMQKEIDAMSSCSEMEWNQVLLARHAVDSTWSNTGSESKDPEQRVITMYECYMQSSFVDGSDKLWQVWTDRDTVFETTEVESTPFEYWTPIPIAHKFYGLSLADVMVDVQMVNTNLLRGVLDHNRLAIHPRMQAKKGAYDVRALLDNRAGTIVEMSELNAVAPLQVSGLPGELMGTLQYMGQVKQERTGQSKASQGLDDSLLKGNKSGVAVDTIVNAGEARLRGIARNLAYLGIAPLMKTLYTLFRDNDTQVYTDDTYGDWSAHDLPELIDTQVAVALGKNAQVEEANFKMQILQYGKESNLLTPEKEYALMMEVLELNGEMNASSYVPTPDELEGMRMQAQMEQMELQKMKDAEPTADAQMAAALQESEQANRQHELQIQEMNAQARIAELELKGQELELDKEKLALSHKEEMFKLQIESQKVQANVLVSMQDSDIRQSEFDQKTAEQMDVANQSIAVL